MKPHWIRRLFGCCIVLAFTTSLHAQWTRQLGQRGFVPGFPFDFSGLDSVNMVNGAVNLTIPLTGLPAGPGGSGLDVTLRYSSAIWDSKPFFAMPDVLPPAVSQFSEISHVALVQGVGWTFGFNYGITEETRTGPFSGIADGPRFCRDSNNNPNPAASDAVYGYRYRAVFPDGSVHVLYLSNAPGNNDGWNIYNDLGNPSPCGLVQSYPALQAPLVYYTADGTRVRVEVGAWDGTGVPWTMYFPDGKKVQGHDEGTESIWDRNDNLITITPVSNATCPDGVHSCFVTEIKDTFQRKISILHFDRTTWFKQAGFGGDLVWKVTSGDTGTVVRSSPMPSSGPWIVHENPCSGTPTAYCEQSIVTLGILSVELEAVAQSHGAVSYQFDYSATVQPPQGQLTKVTLPYGATLEYDWTGFTLVASELNANPVRKKRVIYSNPETGSQTSEWTYTIPYSYEDRASTVENPDGGVVTTYFENYLLSAQLRGREVRVDQPDQSRMEQIWDSQTVNSLPEANPFVKTEIRSVGNGSAPVQAAVKDFTYDLNGNVRSVIEYPWLEYNASNLPHNSAGAVTSINRPNTVVRSTTNIYHVCVDTPCLPSASVNAADEYWRSSAPRLLNAIGSTAVSGSAGSLQFSTFEYDAPRGTGNLRWERHWDDTKPGSSPTTPLTSGNSVGTFRTYATGGSLLTETDPNGNTTSYAYGGGSSHPYPTSVTQSSAPGESLAWALGWDAATGLRTSETDPNSSQTTASYDVRGRIRLLKQGTNARQTETLYDDSAHTVTTKSDLNSFGDGAIQSVRYLDTLGQNYRTVQTDDNGALGIETRSFRRPSSGFTYQLASNPYRSTSDPTMGWTLTKLDKNGRVSEVEYFSGLEKPVPWGTSTNSTGIKQMVYDGEVTKARDEAGKWTYRASDALGRLEKVTEDPGGLGYITTYTYDALDNLTKVCQNSAICPGGQERTFSYTSLKRLLSANNPESGTIGYTYDNNGNLLTRADARGIVTTMAYDGMNRVTTKSYSDGITPNVTYCYDGRTWNGTTCTGSRAAPFLGRLTEEGSGSGLSVASTKFTNYDALGRVKASAQTIGLISYTFGNYSYKLNDGLSQITYPSGRVVTYGYHAGGRVKNVSGVIGTTTTNYTDPNTSISYFPHGGLGSLKLGNQLTEQHCYNPRLQATGIRLGTASTTNCANSSDLLNIALDFGGTQNNGNLQGQTIKRGSQTWSQSYPTTCYDGVNRLTCASESGSGSWSQSYGYDNFGNRWVSGNTNLPSLSNQVPNANWYSSLGNNKISSPNGNWTYDAAGNLQAMSGMPGWGFTYDAENRQITAVTASSPTTIYKYDGEGRRVSKTWNGQTTRFVYDAFGNLAAEYNETAAVTGTQYLTTDHLGSTRLVTNSSGAVVKCYDYLPFGEEIGTTAGRPSCFSSGSYPAAGGATNVEFTAKERDAETGLDYFGARYMSSAQGRFSSPDSKQSSAKLDNPQSWNRYSYTDNNPLAFVDPDGREKLRVTLTTYIPGRTITDPFGRIYNANGDGRGSTPFDYKTRQTATIETDRRISPSGKLGEPTGLVGITQRFDKNGKEIDRAKEPDSAVKQSAGRKEDGSVGISFSGAATNPLGLPGTPSIDFSISITCTGGSCSATGAHDGFPGYRIEVTNEAGKTTEIYTYDPNKAGKTPTALFPPMDCQVPRSEGCAAGQGPKQ